MPSNVLLDRHSIWCIIARITTRNRLAGCMGNFELSCSYRDLLLFVRRTRICIVDISGLRVVAVLFDGVTYPFTAPVIADT